MRLAAKFCLCFVAVSSLATLGCNTTKTGSITDAGTLECTKDADCPAAKPLCNTVKNTCYVQVYCDTSADCGKDFQCKEGVCTPKPPPGNCAVDGCSDGEYCFNGERCLAERVNCSKAPTACSATENCLSTSQTEAYCFGICDPTKNNADNTNASCWDGWGVCLGYDQNDDTAGACLPPMLPVNELDQPCLGSIDPQDPSYFDCKSGLICIADPTGQGPNTCRQGCDPTTGADTNAACNGNGCVAIDPNNPKLGFCDNQPNINDAGEACGGLDPSAPDYGGCKNGLSCAEVTAGHTVCAAACDLFFTGCANANDVCFTQEGAYTGFCFAQKHTNAVGAGCLVATDPFAPEWNDCVELSPCINHVCGAMQAKTRNLHETCDFTDASDPGYNACVDGLACTISRCETKCTVGSTTCGTGAKCIPTISETEGVCLKSCDPVNGTSTNATCSAGQFCYGVSSGNYAPGVCFPLMPPEFGTLALGAECGDPEQGGPGLCDSKQGLFCGENGTCQKACDPRTTPTTECTAQQECSDEAAQVSFKGGVCLALPTQGLNEVCDGVTQRCTSGLGCEDLAGDGSLMLCEKSCVPDSTTCPTGQECVPTDYFGTTGACLPTRTQTRAVEQACDSYDPRGAEYNDCVTGVACVPMTSTGGICFTSCTVGATGACTTGYTCTAYDYYDPSLAACIKDRATTQPRYAKCAGDDVSDPTWNDCDPQYRCIGSSSIGNYYCLDKCTPGSNTCGAGFECLGLSSGGICIMNCTQDSDCTTYGTTCIQVDETDPNHKACI